MEKTGNTQGWIVRTKASPAEQIQRLYTNIADLYHFFVYYIKYFE